MGAVVACRCFDGGRLAFPSAFWGGGCGGRFRSLTLALIRGALTDFFVGV